MIRARFNIFHRVVCLNNAYIDDYTKQAEIIVEL